jgi:hypothetical protein
MNITLMFAAVQRPQGIVQESACRIDPTLYWNRRSVRASLHSRHTHPHSHNDTRGRSGMCAGIPRVTWSFIVDYGSVIVAK